MAWLRDDNLPGHYDDGCPEDERQHDQRKYLEPIDLVIAIVDLHGIVFSNAAGPVNL